MNIREIRLSDHKEIEKIHQQYKNEFDLPSLDKFFAACVVVDEKDEIISVVIAKEIIELITITDKNKSFLKRIGALEMIKDAMKYLLPRAGYDQAHAFIQDSRWLSALKKRGFKTCKGEAVYINL